MHYKYHGLWIVFMLGELLCVWAMTDWGSVSFVLNIPASGRWKGDETVKSFYIPYGDILKSYYSFTEYSCAVRFDPWHDRGG